MIDEPNAEADQEHDIVRKQRMPLANEAAKAAMFDELVTAVNGLAYALRCVGKEWESAYKQGEQLVERARAIK
jgi:hypothetical protein